jgi:hypothetical protein
MNQSKGAYDVEFTDRLLLVELISLILKKADSGSFSLVVKGLTKFNWTNWPQTF